MPQSSLISRWVRIGAGFNAAPARATPDLERLLLETARAAPGDSRLFIMALTWLSRHATLIARHRLARLITTELRPEHQPALGLLLDLASSAARSSHLAIAARACRPAPAPQPLFAIDLASDHALRRAQRTAAPPGLRWNLWVEPLELKPDALRADPWIFEHNPALRVRADFRGDLRTSILAELRDDPAAGASELELARRCAATRAAVRAALQSLESGGHITRRPDGRRLATRLSAA